MRRRKLGKTGIEVSEIAFGGVEIGMPYGIGITGKADMLPEREAVRLLRTALEAGVNFFDTARMYGESERIMGKAFGDRRHDAIIATKCRHFMDKDGNLPPSAELAKRIESSLNESLATLKTDYVDVFMLHQGDVRILENETVSESFVNLKKAGKIRATGVSTYTVDETAFALDKGIWDVIQAPFNLLDQRQKELFPKAAAQGVGLVIRSVLLKGLLSDRGTDLHPALADVEKHIARYGELLTGKDRTLASTAIKYVLSFGEVAAALVGIDSFDYLRQALNTADGNYLTAKELELANALAYPDPSFINLPYWDKMNWLK